MDEKRSSAESSCGRAAGDDMKGWLLVETLAVLLVANAIVRFEVAMAWG